MRKVELLLFMTLIFLSKLVFGQTFVSSFPYNQTFGFVSSAGTTFPTAGDGSEFFNQSTGTRSFTSSTTGGVQKSTSPTGIILLLSNSNTPRILLQLNFSGKTLNGGENLTLNLTKTTTNQRVVRLKIEYGVDTTNFTEFLNTNIYTSSESLQTKIIPIQSNLASSTALDNQSTVYFRLSAVDVSGSGSRPGILIDNIGIDGGVLPVELTSFTATAKGQGVELAWKTATEVNNYGFEVERKVSSLGSARDDKWAKIGFVEGAGNSNAPKEYSFTDALSANGKYLYRLKQIDRDGKFEYSNEVEVVISHLPQKFALMQNYPNPFNPATTISFTVPSVERATLKVYDLTGREVGTLFNEVANPGQTYHVVFNGKGLVSGIYIYVLQTPTFREVKKMQLIK